ncbi:hypothetical protein B0I35DRAFT_512717 [Stachybotrys elegans]|uniref:Uncharacterized protein n=1 Tax=Stachybotrys elegans TaxID=80388 RepID=A0A8K0SQC0_9HYPO|nr:hypothetical protein B0I35DRAFT_512717 [Stachybotrys elegans]
MDDISTAYPVYLGVWTNWSQGKVLGSTLTLRRSDGSLLIAFVAFFTTIVGTQLWRIIAFFLHRYFSTYTSQDALHHQRQIILRNSTSPIRTMSVLFKMAVAWKRSIAQAHPFKRLLPLIAVAFATAVALAAASGFSSLVAQGSEVLVDGTNCGFIKGSDFVNNLTAMAELLDPHLARQTEQAADYAQRCYESKSSSNECSTFVRPALPINITSDAACPFDTDICATPDSNLILDTGYLDSTSHLGLNWPAASRFQMRYQLQCAPLVTEGYRSDWIYEDANFTRYQYGDGSIPPSDCNCTVVVNRDQLGTNTQQPPAYGPNQEYNLMSLFADFHEGSLLEGSYLFEPIPELSGHGGDLILNFLFGNAVVFLEPSEDPWYRATTPINYAFGTSEEMGGEANLLTYQVDEPAWPMGCVVQYEACKADTCTGLGPMMTTFLRMMDELQFNSTFLGAAFYWNLFLPTGNVLANLGRKALASRFQYTNGVQSGITSKSWQLDVIHWFSTSLAYLQMQLAEVAAGPPIDESSGLRDYITTPDADEWRDHCGSQIILSTAYTSFSMFGLVFLFVLGMLIITIATMLEPMALFLEKHFHTLSKYSTLEWRADYALHLHRMAHELSGSSGWKLGLFDIPTTSNRQLLTTLEEEVEAGLPRLLPKHDDGLMYQLTHGTDPSSPTSENGKLNKIVMESTVISIDSPLTIDTAASPNSQLNSGQLDMQARVQSSRDGMSAPFTPQSEEADDGMEANRGQASPVSSNSSNEQCKSP